MRRRALTHVLGIRRESRGRRLVEQTAGTVGLNGATLAFNFLVVLLLSRLLGPEEYGAYAFAIAWALLLSVPAMLGLKQLMVREIAIYRVRSDWSRVRGLLRWANRAALVASLGISLAAAAAFAVSDWPAPALTRPTLVGLALVPLLTLIAIRQSAMQGFGAVVLGRVPEALVAPILMIAVVLVLEAWLADGISARTAAGSQVLAAALATLLGVYLLRRTVPGEVLSAEPLHEGRVWLVGTLPILVASLMQAVSAQAGTILTGSIAGAEEAGIYNVAMRIAMLLSFLFLAAIPALMPAIAELHERGESVALQALLTRAARLVFVVSLPFAIGTIVFAKPILELFGLEFGAGVSALRILSLGQLIGVATGLAGTILIMIGEAGQAMWAVAVGTAVNLLACAALIPTFGVEGAAVATTASISATNILMMYLLWRRRGIYSAVLPFRRAPS